MKRYVLTIALLCSILSVQADVMNAFYREKLILERDIKKIEVLMQETPDKKSARDLEKQLKKLQKQYAIVMKNYSDTQELIKTIAIVDPELFANVSAITNAEGTLTNVYVRFVSRVSEEFTYFTRRFYTADAYTSVRPAKDDEHVCTSLSGTNTITITIGYGCNEIQALGHEFAHVMYIVPNLKEYMNYWNRNQNFCNGHSKSDPSYFIITPIEDSFQRNYMDYMKREKSNNTPMEHIASIRNDGEK